MPGAVRAVLCDLDDTLFDHRRATRESLARVVSGDPCFAGVTLDEIDREHRLLLERLHLEVLAGRLTVEDARVERFRLLVETVAPGEGRARSREMARAYRATYEQCWHLVEGAFELLSGIKAALVTVVIVTNNNVLEQEQKIRRLGLADLVDALVTSQEVGCAKPAPGMFHFALARADCSVDRAVMLGDAWDTDITGARALGMRVVWLNRLGEPSPDASVPELRSLAPPDQALRVILGG
jgi:HAD superfamily hydrolase (TIGR01662 family)